jgi:valyl-tRNA synthetase
VKEEEIIQNVSTAERTGGIVEPLPKLQWWIDVNKRFTIPRSEIPGIESGSDTTLKTIMRQAVESGAVSMPQDGFRSAYFHWIDNLRDWCISRQIWFGHRIPVWYRGSEVYCGIEAPQEPGWKQDEDVLDTWFSSALWTFSTLGWPEDTEDLHIFHPTSFMSPAYEILYLWVSRMILMSGFHLGQPPFKTVLIHGLVRAKDGRKFSKSLNNGIEPLEMIEKYGADALRMGLMVGAAIGSDIKFDEQRVKGYKHFANKVWNITRFVLEADPGAAVLNEADQELVRETNRTAAEVTGHLEEFKFHLAAETLYHYVWHRFADEIIEASKPILKGADEAARLSRAAALHQILLISLKLLHPFMPFITEAIWQELPVPSGVEGAQKESDLLMVAKWPV